VGHRILLCVAPSPHQQPGAVKATAHERNRQTKSPALRRVKCHAAVLTIFVPALTLNSSDFLSVFHYFSAGQPILPCTGFAHTLKPSALPADGPPFFERFGVPVRHRCLGHAHLVQTYAEEAARLRNLAVSVTTAPLRSRLLEEADHQERLAQTIKPSVRRPYRPTTARDADFGVPGERR